MHKLRIFLALQIILASMFTTAYADNTGTPVANVPNTNTGTAVTNSGSSTSDDTLGSGNVVSAYDNLFKEVGDATNNDTASSVSTTLAPVVASILGFFAVVIPLGLLAYTGLELACIFFKPLRPMFGAEGGSGGDMSGGSGGKKVFLQVSEDCIAAINGSNGGSGDMSGGSGQKSLGDIALNYLKLRFKTLVICIVTIGLLATPVGYKIILKLTELIFFVISKIFTFIAG